MLTAKSIEFSAETKVSGIEFVPLKDTKLTAEQLEEIDSLTKCLRETGNDSLPLATSNKKGRVHDMLVKLAQSGEQVKILKGSVESMLKLSEGLVNEAEVKWKSQEISKNGETPLVVSINQEVIGLIALKDNLKENIRKNIGEIRATGIHTIMITGDTQLTAQVIAREANIDEVMAQAKPTDKLQQPGAGGADEGPHHRHGGRWNK